MLKDAIRLCAERNVPVFTFALYFDHESDAISVCVDTEANSRRAVAETNRFNSLYFQRAIREGDLSDAGLWQANIGRNLSLGDFALVNVARIEMPHNVQDDEFFLQLVRSLIALQNEVAQLSPDSSRLILACSGPNDEVGFVWSIPQDAESTYRLLLHFLVISRERHSISPHASSMIPD